LTHWKRLWCWEGLGAGGEGDDRGWDGWMASLTRWTWVWVNSRVLVMDREAWRAAIHGVAKSRTRLSDWSDLKGYQPLERQPSTEGWTFKLYLILMNINSHKGLVVLHWQCSLRLCKQFFFFFLTLWLPWVFVAVHRISPAAARWGSLLCGAQASRCGGFSCSRTSALGAWASVGAARRLSSLADPGLSCSMHGIFDPGCSMWNL